MSTTTPSRAPAKLTVQAIRQRKGAAKLVALTAYDVMFARLADAAGVDIVLVGDSLGMMVQGHANTLPVTLEDVVYHTRAVARGVAHAHLVADMPFMSYQASLEDGIRAAGRLLQQGGAESVKIEGGAEVAELVHRLTTYGIPVMAHVGMTPQSVHQYGGFKVQGREEQSHKRILDGALAVVDAGAYAVVVESVPEALGQELTQRLHVPTIGIGAGANCDGQILVMHDVLGLDPHWKPRFARQYAALGQQAQAAFAAYADDVRHGRFPSNDETFK
ncbi:MAG: 3-methyl-2-oxobutanoate hydroxymethyltransferase [Deltaproteobacteria bacterium]|nr:3-methyl-2-oxobutanoate hydroxymethyltransferase [Deltaproteobacteria bacterium]